MNRKEEAHLSSNGLLQVVFGSNPPVYFLSSPPLLAGKMKGNGGVDEAARKKKEKTKMKNEMAVTKLTTADDGLRRRLGAERREEEIEVWVCVSENDEGDQW